MLPCPPGVVRGMRMTNHARPDVSKLSARMPDEVKPMAVVYQPETMLVERVTGPEGWMNGSRAALFDSMVGLTSLARVPFCPGPSSEPAGWMMDGSSEDDAKPQLGIW